MRWFRWNSFTIIGLVLLVIGLYSLVKGVGFQFDSGLPAERFESWFYLLVGVLMVLNGVVQPQFAAALDANEQAAQAGAAAAAPVTQPATRPIGTNAP